MKVIKCHICKLDRGTCNYKCTEVENVEELYREGVTENDAIPDRFCTAHRCSHNPTGLKCELNRCVFGKVIGEPKEE